MQTYWTRWLPPKRFKYWHTICTRCSASSGSPIFRSKRRRPSPLFYAECARRGSTLITRRGIIWRVSRKSKSWRTSAVLTTSFLSWAVAALKSWCRLTRSSKLRRNNHLKILPLKMRLSSCPLRLWVGERCPRWLLTAEASKCAQRLILISASCQQGAWCSLVYQSSHKLPHSSNSSALLTLIQQPHYQA